MSQKAPQSTSIREPSEVECSNSSREPQEPPKKRFPKWRRTMILWSVAAGLVFIFNLVFSIWAYLRASNDDLTLPYNRNLYEGSCSNARSINSGLHVLINILGTLLLGGSNYCMQILLSPTRQEVDKAHSKKLWLDIGVLSIRNLGRISKLRVALWSVLGLTSLSLHLL
jgi:hypothetical protein